MKSFELLEKITSATMSHLKYHNIVLPSLFFKTFLDYSKLFGEANDEHDLHTLLQDDFGSLYKDLELLVAKSKEETCNAMGAIQNKDWMLLDKSYKALEKLQLEISSLEEQLYRDTLTGLYNRKWFEENYVKDGKFIKDGSMVFIDLNNFKSINDTHGHVVGDAVLRFFANFFKDDKNLLELSQINLDIVRFAGDEFVLLVDCHQTDKIELIMEKINILIQNKALALKNGEKFYISFAYGTSSFSKGESLNDIIHDSDKKMYLNKMKNK